MGEVLACIERPEIGIVKIIVGSTTTDSPVLLKDGFCCGKEFEGIFLVDIQGVLQTVSPRPGAATEEIFRIIVGKMKE